MTSGPAIQSLATPSEGGGFNSTMDAHALSHDEMHSPDRVAGYGTPAAGGRDAMLRQLSATSEGFAYGSTALTAALRGERRAVIAASLTEAHASSFMLTCWHCAHDEHGIALSPMPFVPAAFPSHAAAESSAAQILRDCKRGDVLVVCDPWGENEVLCRTLRMAPHRGVTTVAVTSDQPNLLAALASHAVRVPAAAGVRREFVVGALEHFIQTAGTTLVPKSRRITSPLRRVEIG
jgi:hypothetical protein